MDELERGTDNQREQFAQLYRDGQIDGVAIVAADGNACSACTELADRMYLPSRLPELPTAGCSRPSGCRCRYEASFTVYE